MVDFFVEMKYVQLENYNDYNYDSYKKKKKKFSRQNLR